MKGPWQSLLKSVIYSNDLSQSYYFKYMSEQKMPETEEEKANMEKPFPSNRCPKKYLGLDLAWNSYRDRHIFTVPVDCQRINHFAITLMKELLSSLSLLLLKIRYYHQFACADGLNKALCHTVTELIPILIFDYDSYIKRLSTNLFKRQYRL